MEEPNKMTIHRGLAELKLIDARIEKGINEIIPNAVYQKEKPIEGHLSLDEFSKYAQSKYDSIVSLMDRKNKIKTAIVKKNAEVEITVAGSTMTIADAITKKTNIKLKQIFSNTLR